MINLCTTGTNNVAYTLGSLHSAMDYYNSIKVNLADPEIYQLFAMPIVMGGDKIIWQTPLSGTAKCYKELNPVEQGEAKMMLSRTINQVNDAVAKLQNPQLSEFITTCLEIPDTNSIYVVDSNGRRNIVLVSWGFVSALPGNQKGWLDVFLEAKKASIRFDVWYYVDGKQKKGLVAADIPLKFEVEGNSLIINSDSEGHITLSGYKEGTKGRVCEADEASSSPVVFDFYEDLVYDIWITPRANMTFQVEDQDGHIVPNMGFRFEYGGKSENLVSDANGQIVLPGMRDGDRVDTYQSQGSAESTNNFNSFVFDSKQALYKIIVNMPKINDMRFRVERPTGEAIPNMGFTFELQGGRIERILSDANGMIELRGVAHQDRVSAYHEDGQGGRLYPHSFVNDLQEDIHHIVIAEEPDTDGWITITVTDPKGNPKPNSRVKVKYLGKVEELLVDQDSKVKVKAPKGTQIEVLARHRWFWF